LGYHVLNELDHQTGLKLATTHSYLNDDLLYIELIIYCH
jgi:hypothetical protein